MNDCAMIIDDSLMFRKQFREELSYRKAFKKILLARSGSEAIKKQKKYNPHIIFLDMQMPVLGGPETLKQIRSFDKQVKVYVVSAYPREDYQDRIENLNVFDWLAKPDITKPEELDSLVKQLIESSRQDSMNYTKLKKGQEIDASEPKDKISYIEMAYETAKILNECPKIVRLFEDVFAKEVPILKNVLQDLEKLNFRKIKEDFALRSSRMKRIEEKILKD